MPSIDYNIEKVPGRPVTPETEAKPERTLESPGGFEAPKVRERGDSVWEKMPVAPSAAAGVAVAPPELSVKNIEAVLSADLEGVYLQLPPDKQAEFKTKGEQAARDIKALLEKVKVKARKITKIILAWLKIIPGINRFFLEQESKIKTDEILKLKNKQL